MPAVSACTARLSGLATHTRSVSNVPNAVPTCGSFLVMCLQTSHYYIWFFKICVFTLKMLQGERDFPPAGALPGWPQWSVQGQDKGRASYSLPHGWQGLRHWVFHCFPHQQGAGWELGKLGLEPVPRKDAGVTCGRRFPHCTTSEAPPCRVLRVYTLNPRSPSATHFTTPSHLAACLFLALSSRN